MVLWHAKSGGVHAPEIRLRGGVALLSSQTIPAYGFGLVFEDSLTGVVHEPEGELRVGVSPLSGLLYRGEIALCQEYSDGEQHRHDHGSSCAD